MGVASGQGHRFERPAVDSQDVFIFTLTRKEAAQRGMSAVSRRMRSAANALPTLLPTDLEVRQQPSGGQARRRARMAELIVAVTSRWTLLPGSDDRQKSRRGRTVADLARDWQEALRPRQDKRRGGPS